jgi:thiamine biosynthesis lipoprotein ApbE
VIAATATIADALSTAIAVAPRDHAATLLRAGGGMAALLFDQDGNTHRI